MTGYFSLALHAHLPFVRHPEHEEFLEEDWFYEALTECYIPLLDQLFGLAKREVPFKMTLSLSPPLLSMLSDSLLKERYLRYLDRAVELSEKELARTKNMVLIGETAKMYFLRLTRVREFFYHEFNTDLIHAFTILKEAGHLELITSAATHAYLPLLSVNKKAVRAQVKMGLNHFKTHFHCHPKGIWLPECAYSPEIDSILKEEEVTFFFAETHGVLFASPPPKFGVYAPVYNRDAIAVFGRDPDSSRQVWSSEEGYPGDPCYRDFYRDAGYDLPIEYIRPYIQPDGTRKFTGIKYYRISSKGTEKFPYDREKALARVREHAEDFFLKKERQAEHLVSASPPLITAPFDAELFGHWWFEGPEWIAALLEKMSSPKSKIRLTTPTEYLSMHPLQQMSEPAVSSWGHNGYNDAWLDETNNWIYPLLHNAADRMTELLNHLVHPEKIHRRALNQAGRELMLAQSSDWAFIMKTGTSPGYAASRTRAHLSNFNRLYDGLMKNSIDPEWLEKTERQNNIFPDMDYRVFI